MPPSVARLEAEPITLETVRAVAKANFDAGYRFVTLSVHNLGDGNLDIIYHYDKNLNMRHYRLTVPLGQAVPSISDIYFCALLVENESRDQYGITWDGLILDFQGSLYLEKDTPPPLLRGPSCTLSTVTKKEGARHVPYDHSFRTAASGFAGTDPSPACHGQRNRGRSPSQAWLRPPRT